MTDPSLTDLQLHILDILWSRPESTVVEVQEALRAERKLAQSSVATLLSRLERKKLVTHRVEGRQFYYRAAVEASTVRRSVARELSSLTDRLFGGDVAELVSHLLAKSDIGHDDLSRVRAMIDEKERELRRKKRGRR